MSDLLFYIFAGMTLLFGFLVVANPFTKNPVTSAMFLVLSIISMAGLFVLLNAFFLAAVQILVYAGAVIVLFLFVIMLLDIKGEMPSDFRKSRLAFSVLLTGLTAVVFTTMILTSGSDLASGTPVLVGSTEALGKLLYTRYIIPLEIMSLLLLVGMIGVVLLSKKDLK